MPVILDREYTFRVSMYDDIEKDEIYVYVVSKSWVEALETAVKHHPSLNITGVILVEQRS